MLWWNDVGAVEGWGGCLLVLFALLAFWGVVIAGVMAIFRTTRPTTGAATDDLSVVPTPRRESR